MFKGITYKRRKLTSWSSLTSSIDDLNGDELVEIFTRLPLESVHCSKCVSKRWKAIISDPCFIRLYIDRHGSAESLISNKLILYRIEEEGMKSAASTRFGHFALPKPISPSSVNKLSDLPKLTKSLDFSFRFLPLKFTQLEKFEIVRISHGLVLCKAYFKKHTKRPYRSSIGVYYVCNPLTKQWLKIPPLHHRTIFKVGPVGFMCWAPDPELFPWKIEFVVLEVEYKRSRDDTFFYTHVFSSQTGKWNNYRVTCHPGFNWFWRSWQIHEYISVVVHRGMFYWTGECSQGLCLIAYDPLNQPSKCTCILLGKRGYKIRHLSLHEGKIRGIIYSESNPNWYICDFDVDKRKHTGISGWVLNENEISEYKELSFLSSTNGEVLYVKNYDTGIFWMLTADFSVGAIVLEPLGRRHSKLKTRFALYLYSWTSWPTVIPQLPCKSERSC